MAIKIETDIPPPVRWANPSRPRNPHQVGRPQEWPWDDMHPGDSILLPLGAKFPSSSIQNWCKKHPGSRFASRTEDGRIRVWRTA